MTPLSKMDWATLTRGLPTCLEYASLHRGRAIPPITKLSPGRSAGLPLTNTTATTRFVCGAVPQECPRASAADFIDAGGRHVVLPDHIGRVLPAERNAEVMVFVLAPDKLVGLERVGLAKRPARPVLGWRPRTVPASLADTARHLHPDLIIDAGSVTPDRAAFADQVSAQTGIPYILIDDSFARLPRSMRSIAAILDADARHTRDLYIWAEHAIAGLRGRLLIRPANQPPHVYSPLRLPGLPPALPGSPPASSTPSAA